MPRPRDELRHQVADRGRAVTDSVASQAVYIYGAGGVGKTSTSAGSSCPIEARISGPWICICAQTGGDYVTLHDAVAEALAQRMLPDVAGPGWQIWSSM